MHAEPQRHIVLVGGGHAHVQVLTRFAMDPPARARLTVVLDRPVAVYSGMIPGLVAGQYEKHEVEIDVVPLARRAQARVILSPATGVDADEKTILFADRPPLRYDIASLDIGSTVAGLDLPGIRDFALPTRPVARFVERIDALEAKARDRGADEPFRVTVVGAGAGGVELAFTLETRLANAGVDAIITLVQGGTRILTGYPGTLVERVEANAEARGIQLLVGPNVVAAKADRVFLDDGEPIPFDTLIWVTGAEGHPGFGGLGLATDGRGFVLTRPTLQVEGHDDLFAVGDCGTLVDYPDTPKAGVYAVRQGPVVAENLIRRLSGKPLERYRPQHDFLTLLNLGDGSALGAKWGRSFEGRWVMRWKNSIDRKFMRRFQVLEPDGRQTEAFAGEPLMTNAVEAPPCGGCAAKLAQGPLARALTRLPLPPAAADEAIEIGLSAPDDAAIWHTSIGARVGSSVDLFAAFTDDPWIVGRVAAVNALSDLWATAVTPRVAQAIVALPEDLDPETAEEILFQVLAGARRELDRAEVALAGGHTTTVTGRLMVGFSVEGELESGGFGSGEPLRKGGLRPDDVLILTKALGTGVLFRADMAGLARGPSIEAALRSMLRPNREAASRALAHGASAMTDVTGFGLVGHLVEMLTASGVSAQLELQSVPALPGALELLRLGVRSTFHDDNEVLRNRLAIGIGSSVDDEARIALLFDPQTSGGLLFGVNAGDAEFVIAEVRAGGDSDAAIVGRVASPRADGKLISFLRRGES